MFDAEEGPLDDGRSPRQRESGNPVLTRTRVDPHINLLPTLRRPFNVLTAYVAGAYTAQDYRQRERNITIASGVSQILWGRGICAALCPHLNTARFDDHLDLTHDNWMQGYIELMLGCDIVVVAPGWEGSTGTKQEIDVATQASMPVFFYPDLPSPDWIQELLRRKRQVRHNPVSIPQSS